MAEKKAAKSSRQKKEVLEGKELAETIRRLLMNEDAEGVREIVRDCFCRTSLTGRKRQAAVKVFFNAVAALGREEGVLEALLRSLETAEAAYFRQVSRDFPDLPLRRPNTLARLMALVAEHAPPRVRKRVDRAFRTFNAPSGVGTADAIAAALERQAELAAARAVERFVVRFEGNIEGDEWSSLRAELDGFVKSLV